MIEEVNLIVKNSPAQSQPQVNFMQVSAHKPGADGEEYQPDRQACPHVGAEQNVSAKKGKHRAGSDKDKFPRAARPGRDKKTHGRDEEGSGFDKPKHGNIAGYHAQAGIPLFGVNGYPQGDNKGRHHYKHDNVALPLHFIARGKHAGGKQGKNADMAGKQDYP